jgi:hypothetical protein
MGIGGDLPEGELVLGVEFFRETEPGAESLATGGAGQGIPGRRGLLD